MTGDQHDGYDVQPERLAPSVAVAQRRVLEAVAGLRGTRHLPYVEREKLGER